MGYGYRLRLRGKLAVVLDRPGSHRVLVWTMVPSLIYRESHSICFAAISDKGSPNTYYISFSSMKSGGETNRRVDENNEE